MDRKLLSALLGVGPTQQQEVGTREATGGRARGQLGSRTLAFGEQAVRGVLEPRGSIHDWHSSATHIPP